MSRKRTSEMIQPEATFLVNKRAMAPCKQVQTSSVEFKLPMQQQELGKFWISSPERFRPRQAAQEVHLPHSPSCSRGGGGLSISLSLAEHCPRSCRTTEDVDIQDTATSSGSADSCAEVQQRLVRTKALALAGAAGEEDSISSHQQMPGAAPAFSFGSRPSVDPDVCSLYCWEVLHHLLDDI